MIQKRVFLVGCPRSGTTMLQTVLAAHPVVQTFPETRLFRSVVSQQPLLRRWGWASHHAAERLRILYGELGLCPDRVRWRGTVRGYAADLFAELDAQCESNGHTVWLEKTPDHLYHVGAIQSLLPGALFIHLVRDGAETIASLVDVTRRYPQAWGKEPWPLEVCVSRWIKDAECSLAWVGQPGHLWVSYEPFVADPEAGAHRLCEFLKVPYSSSMLARGEAPGAEAVLEDESWKARSTGAISAGGGKFAALLTPEEQAYVKQEIEVVQARVAEVCAAQ